MRVNRKTLHDASRRANVSGDPAHQHRYITVGVNTPVPQLHSSGLGVSVSSPVALFSVELQS